jgi:hypothetical protein
MPIPAVTATAAPLVYVSGPLTGSGTFLGNVRNALTVAKALIDRGCAVVVPHEHVLLELLAPEDYEYWLQYDLRLLARCDAVYRLPGASPGADREVAEALRAGIPVFHSFDTLFAWFHTYVRP